MQIKIQRPSSRTIYPDIEDNLSLPESERFAIQLERPSEVQLAEVSLEYVSDGNGHVQQKVNTNAITRAFIKKMINPPDLEVDGKTRKMTTADLFRFDEFSEIMREIDGIIGELRREAGDRKNS